MPLLSDWHSRLTIAVISNISLWIVVLHQEKLRGARPKIQETTRMKFGSTCQNRISSRIRLESFPSYNWLGDRQLQLWIFFVELNLFILAWKWPAIWHMLYLAVLACHRFATTLFSWQYPASQPDDPRWSSGERRATSGGDNYSWRPAAKTWTYESACELCNFQPYCHQEGTCFCTWPTGNNEMCWFFPVASTPLFFLLTF